MRFPIYTIAIPLLAAVAFGQDTPPVQPAPAKQPTESATPSKPASSQQGQSDRTAGETSGTTSGSTPASMSGSKSGAQASDRLPEMKTLTYSGTLMDASCAGVGSAAATPAATPSASSASAPVSADHPAATSSADRSAPSGSNASCAVSASTTQFALKMKDGSTARFDDVGNVRAQEAMKTRKKWSDAATANTPIRVKASGVLNGDKLTVLSVN